MWQKVVAAGARLGFAWARRRLDDEARLELESHRALLVERYVRAGMTLQDAERAARRQLGNVTIVREDIYRMNGLPWVDRLAQDLKYAGRQIRRAPGFTAVAVATLALGIGGTTAVFSVVRAVLLAPLPYEEPGQLVRIYQQEPRNPSTRYYVTGAHFSALREVATSFEEVTALQNYSESGLDLVQDGEGQRLRVLPVTSDYFATFRAGTLVGSGFTPEDETGHARGSRSDTGRRRVVLSDALWRTRFAANPSVVGGTVLLSSETYEIAGVAPRDFEDPIVGAIDVWVPYHLARDTDEQNHSLSVVARLRNGVSVEQAAAELAALSQSLDERWPGVRRSALVVVPLRDDLVGTSRGPLHLLFLAVGLVLLVACVNVANLALVRATGRVHEFAVRAALGSGRRRLAGQLLVESLLLAGLGGICGLMLAGAGVRALRQLGRDALPRLADTGLDPIVLAFAVVVTVATAICFGIAPAFRLARVAPNDALRRQTRSATGTRAQARFRGGLAAAQLAVALTLLAGAAVLLASFHRLQQVNLGVRTERVLTFDVNLPTVRYGQDRRAAFQEELAVRIQRIPGVKAAGGASRLPATGSYHPWVARIETGPAVGTSLNFSRGRLQNRTVSGNYFAALGIPLLAGRIFDERDDARAPARAVVSGSFARAGFPGMALDAVPGQRIRVLGQPREIIGVVGDVALDVYGSPSAIVYHAHRQFASNRNWALTQIVASDVPPRRDCRRRSIRGRGHGP